MDKARSLADGFAGSAQESNRIVIDFAFNLSHAIEVTRCRANRFDCPLRDSAAPVPCFADLQFDLQPGVNLASIVPDVTHRGTGVAVNHRVFSSGEGSTH